MRKGGEPLTLSPPSTFGETEPEDLLDLVNGVNPF